MCHFVICMFIDKLYFALNSKKLVRRQACSIICATISRRKPEYENITL